MLSEKERLILDIINDVQESLSESQLERLKLSLYQRIAPLDIKTAEANIVPSEVSNQRIINLWLMAKTMDNLSPRTIRAYRLTVERFDREMQKPFQAISALEIKCYLAKIAQTSSPTNANNMRAGISAIYGWMFDAEFITKNPMRMVPKMKVRKKQKQPFTTEEVEKLRYGAKDIRTRSMVEMLLSTGCRVSELVGIRRDEIDWQRGEVKVVGKGNKERIVFLNEPAKLYLKKYFDTRKDDRPDIYVSEQKPYTPLGISTVEKDIRDLGRLVGVKDTHPHRFRHTVATWASRRGMGVELIQKMLGHESVNTTMIYTTTDLETLRAARRKYCD